VSRYVRLLRRRDYRLLWTGATISALGDGMSFVALVWLVLERGGDAGAVGLLAAAYTAPVLIGGLAAGIVLDRFERRRVLAADNLVRGLVIASVPVAAALGVLTTPQLFIVAGIYGLLFMVSLAGIPSLLPSLVDPDDLTTANAMESLSYGIAGVGGPALAGAIIALLGAPVVLAIDAVTYGVLVGCLLLMRGAPVAAADPQIVGGPVPEADAVGPAGPAARVAGGLGPAIRFVLRTPAILAITLIYMTTNIGEGMFLVLLPVYARDVLTGDAATYGLLASSFTAGSLIGAFAVGAVTWPWPLGRSIAAAVLATGLVFGFLLPSPPLPLAVGILALAGLAASSLTAWAQTIRMRLIPSTMRGRVFALLRTLMQGTPPVGAIVAGAMLSGGGGTAAVIVAIVVVIAVPGAVGLLVPALGREATGEAVALRTAGPPAG
jgi:MFS family permease